MNNSSILEIISIIQVLDHHFMEGGISETYLQPSYSQYHNVYMGGTKSTGNVFVCLLSKYYHNSYLRIVCFLFFNADSCGAYSFFKNSLPSPSF